MKKKITLFHSLQFLFLALLFVATTSCGDDDTKSNCTADVDLGLFAANFEIPYGDTLEVIELVSEKDSTGLLSVNHPVELGFFGISTTATTTVLLYDCEALNSVENYRWMLSAQQALILTVLNDTFSGAPLLLVKETPLVDEKKPQDGPIGIFLEFYDEEPSGQLKDSPFMRVMTQELQVGKGSGYEYGFTLLGNITIKGETFEQVYTNTESLMGDIHHIYYNRSLGLIGFQDKQDVLWRIDE